MLKCFECDAPGEHHHHVVPQVLGGQRTLPLCGDCHAKVHQIESTSTSALVKEGHRQARLRGIHVGGLPFGQAYSNQLDVDGKRLIVPAPAELAALLIIRQMHRGGASPSEIAKALNTKGFTNRRRNTWKTAAVKRLVKQDED